MTPTTALGAAFLIALIDWAAVACEWKRMEYIFKPATLIAVIIGAWLLTQEPHDVWQARFFLPGLILSLIGDVFLMLPGEHFFLPGVEYF